MNGISIIICTRDRASDLALTLESLAQVRIPEGKPVELLVVDNGSRDNTAAVVKHWHPQLGLEVRYLHVPTAGKGYAYNAGLKAARGDIFLFTDDDVRLQENWIERMIAPIENGYADAVAGGVRFAPHLIRSWLPPTVILFLASTENVREDGDWGLVGANMCFHRRILDTISGFDENLGPGSKYGFAEDTLLTMQLKEHGLRLVPALDIFVEHHFAANRLCSRAILRRVWLEGKARAYIAWHWSQRGPDSYRKELLKVAICSFPYFPRWLWLMAFNGEHEINEKEVKTLYRLAFLWQYLLETRSTPAYPMKGARKLNCRTEK